MIGRLALGDEAGKASWRGLLALVLVAAVVYVGFKVLPVRTAAYQFQDAVRDEVVFAGSRRSTDDAIRRSLTERAAELGLPVTSREIRIRRPGPRYIVIEATYTVRIDFVGGYSYDWTFTPRAEGPLIY